MRRFLSFAAALTILILAGPDTVCAQVEKTFQRTTMNGRTVQTPYVTYEEFRSVLVRSPDGQVPLRTLLSVSSLEEATRLLGDPQSVERNVYPDGETFTVWLHYGGDTTVEYDGFADGTLELVSIELRSSGWGLKIGDKALSPGMDAGRLDAAVRRSAVPDPRSKKANVSGTGAIYIAKPNTAKSGTVEPLANGLTQFNFEVDETGTIEVVRLSRVPSN